MQGLWSEVAGAGRRAVPRKARAGGAHPSLEKGRGRGDGGNHLQYTRRLEPLHFHERREMDALPAAAAGAGDARWLRRFNGGDSERNG
jgi:hypothetical protein